jgi:hypothetical protein
MQVVEQHVIKRTESRSVVIDRAALASKNLSTAALSEMRQSFICEQLRLTYPEQSSLHNKRTSIKCVSLPARATLC